MPKDETPVKTRVQVVVLLKMLSYELERNVKERKYLFLSGRELSLSSQPTEDEKVNEGSGKPGKYQ
jgi:hypothetical protein